MRFVRSLAAALLTGGLALVAVPAAAQAAPVPGPEPVPVPMPSTGSTLPEENLVPNINGYPCSGSWESGACYAMSMGDSPMVVQPRSTVSSSP